MENNSSDNISSRNIPEKRSRRLWQKTKDITARCLRFMRILRFLSPFHYLKRLDTYIITKFIGTYFFAIALIISISIVFDFNENLAKFSQYHAPWRAIVLDYYANFVPYFANLFSPLFVFIAVIFFTSKMAGNSEIIAIISAGVSFRRLMRPYLISCVIISSLSYTLAAYVIPKGNVVRQNFESMYKNKRKNTQADNVQIQVDRGVIAYIQHYDNERKQGFGFCLDKFENKKLVSHMTAASIQYDTIADSKYHWKAMGWKIREMKGMREYIKSGSSIDTLIQMEPMDLVFSKGQQETFTSPQLKEYISKQIDRGSKNIVQYEVEYHKRIASSFASFILATIGVSLSSIKRKDRIRRYPGVCLARGLREIMRRALSATFAINAGAPAALAAWMPNIIFAVIAFFCYKKAPQ